MKVYSYKPPKVSSTKLKPVRKFKFKFNLKKTLTWVFRLFAVGIFAAAMLFLYYAKDLPDPNKLLDRQVPESTKIFARDNSLLYEIHGEYKRTLVNLDQISPDLKNATVAVEDKDFYKHGGISFTGIARAIMVDILSGKKSQGGSTITQQFVKKSILTDDKSWDRKIRELILAVAIDSRFSKEDILKFYLNEIPYGRNAYGIEAASQSYFNKSAKDLTLAESAYLAAMPQAPTFYNPFGPNRTSLDNRKNTILYLMQQQGYITDEQKNQAENEKVNFSKITTGIKAPHFVLWVQDYLANKFGEKTLEEGGLKIYTTLDPRLQDIAETAVKNGVEKSSKKYNANNAALVAIDPKTGQILAMVGSKDYFAESEPAGCIPGKNCTFEPNVNVALSQRQPGSSFKPYVYGTAFKKEFGFAPASMLMDVVTNFGTFNGKSYIPGNYNGESFGPVSMRKAMAGSLNVPAVKTLALVGVENAVQTARDLGITSPLADCGLSLVLGGCEVRLVDHVAAMSVIANEGIKNEKTPILKIVDKENNTIEEFKSNPQSVFDPQAAYEVISIMTDNAARSYVFGASSPLILSDRPVAAKTGTTQNWHDGWTLGFTPSLAAGVWAGNNNGELLKKGADGVFVAAPIWHEFMTEALKGTPAEDFQVPSGIQKVVVDELSGKLPTDITPSTKTETFASYSVPTAYDNIHVKVAIDSLTGQPADSTTPQERIIYKPYTVLHSEKRDNANWENPVVEWALAHGYIYPPNDAQILQPSGDSTQNLSINILEPADGSIVSQTPFSVTANVTSSNPIAKVELYINGELYKNSLTQPYTFIVDRNLNDGSYTLALKAIDISGNTADTSATVTVMAHAPPTLSEPLDQSMLVFPVTLTAEGTSQYPTVSFYYQNSKGQNTLIGNAANVDHVGSVYRYTYKWLTAPDSGSYKLFVQTNNNAVSKKIRVTIP
ncbi:MAG: PBP1A family penicillin-binding protein [Candidatus Doudnabacteria bacterium]|jgi:1A family penicillin-binding protein